MNWPTELPNPTSSYSLKIQNSAQRTKMESGRIRQRRKFTQGRFSISVEWELTDEEFLLFQSFVYHALNGGTDWFYANFYSGGGQGQHKVRIQKGDYTSTYLDYMHWKVKANLDVEMVNLLSDSELFDQLFDAGLISSEMRDALNRYLPITGV